MLTQFWPQASPAGEKMTPAESHFSFLENFLALAQDCENAQSQSGLISHHRTVSTGEHMAETSGAGPEPALKWPYWKNIKQVLCSGQQEASSKLTNFVTARRICNTRIRKKKSLQDLKCLMHFIYFTSTYWSALGSSLNIFCMISIRLNLSKISLCCGESSSRNSLPVILKFWIIRKKNPDVIQVI